MRKTFLWTVAAIGTFGVWISGCGKQGEGREGKSDAPGKSKILLLDTGIEEVNQKTWHAAIARFEKSHPGATVDFRPSKDDDYSQGGILIAALRSKNPPDVYFEWAWSAVARDAGNGTALDLTPFISEEIESYVEPRAWAGTKFNGKTYMLPAAFEVANFLFYRKKTLTDQGIEPPKTWEDFIAACKKLKESGVQPIFQGNQAAWPAGNWASELSVCYLGLDHYQEAGLNPPKTRLTDPGFVKALTLMKQLKEIGAFNSDVNTLNDNEGLARFTGGEGAFTFAGSWILDQLTETGGAEVYGILPRPQLPDQPPNSRYILANSAGYMINTKTPKPELAFDLLRELLTLDVQRIRVQGGLNSIHPDAQKEIDSPMQRTVLATLREGGEWVAAPDISWNRFTAERFYEAVKQVVGGEAEPPAALQAAERDVAARAAKGG